MAEPLHPVTVDPGAGTTIQGPAGGPLTFKVRGEQTGGLLTVFENIVAPGDGPPRHTHANEDESWYVLEGRLRFELGGELRNAPQGAFVFVPTGVRTASRTSVDATRSDPSSRSRPPGWRRSSNRFAELRRRRSTRVSSRASNGPGRWTCSGRRWRSSDPL